MRKFELMRDYPRHKVPQVAIEDENGNFKIDEKHLRSEKYDIDYFTKNPEFWKEVKEPLFTTFDGVDIFIDDTYYVIKDFKHSRRSAKDGRYPYNANRFSSLLIAENWIEENKPIFSRKQILKAVNKLCNTLNFDNFNKELGL